METNISFYLLVKLNYLNVNKVPICFHKPNSMWTRFQVLTTHEPLQEKN
jgi:hypothetical protein